jgi:integrase
MTRSTKAVATLHPNHRAAWQATRRASRLSETTLNDRERVLARFLDFVDDIGALDPEQPIAAHVTRETVRTYVHARWSQTPKMRFEDLRFLRETILMLAPSEDWRWLMDAVKVLGKDRHTLQPSTGKRVLLDSDTALAAAEAAVADSALPADAQAARVRARDAALVALVADTVLRIGTVAALCMQVHVSRRAGSWFLHVPGSLTKTGRPERRRLGPHAARVLDAYLATLPPLPHGEALWRSQTGAALSPATLKSRFPRALSNVTGLRAGPHAFRHARASERILESGGERASLDLGHVDPAVTRWYYVRSTPADVAASAQPIVSPFD